MNYNNKKLKHIHMVKIKSALITGINGQDGSYLAELLLEKGYIVHGIIRRSSNANTSRINHLINNHSDKGTNINLHYGDMTDSANITNIINEIKPDDIYIGFGPIFF